MMALLANPIGDRSGLFRHLEPLAEGLGEPLQLGLGKAAAGGEDLAGDRRIEGDQARVVACFRGGVLGQV